MTGAAFATAVLWSYALAAAAFLALAVRMAIGLKRSRPGALLLVGVVVTAAWAVAGATFGLTGRSEALLVNGVADAIRYAVWYAFVVSLLTGPGSQRASGAFPKWWFILIAALLVGAIGLSAPRLLGVATTVDPRLEFGLRLGWAIVGLVFVEHLYRSAHVQARWAIKPVVLALAALYGYDLFLFADALLFGRLDVDIWAARGAANALLIPFFVVATARNKGWTIEMHLSRDAVFHSTALLASGAFLLLVAGTAYVVRFIGGEWGRVLAIELVFAAAVFIGLVATSGRFRSRLKVFVSKHFFSYRYDYREEWLRFTRTLSTESPVHGTQERAIMALADLVESPGGALWLVGENRLFRPAGRLNMPQADFTLDGGSSMAQFLERTGWIISIPEAARASAQYPGLELPDWVRDLPNAWLIVPLSTGAQLIGFVLLLTPRTPISVDWEVRDLVKAAARAAAAYLQQIQASEALLEARKFDAFNRMSAFVVHDLKNLVSQLSLMLKNAERHHANPEFQRDMLGTVTHVVSRMNALMLQLQTGTTPVENARPVHLAPLVRQVWRAKLGRRDSSPGHLPDGIYALGHEDRLEHVIGHLIQNALDATIQGGTVTVSLGRDEHHAWIDVVDTGVGMTAEFQRDRLFKPFETTKPAGMGIGVYESQQYVASVGGRITVDSSAGNGTRIRVRIPAAEGSGAPSHSLEEAA